MLFSFQCPLCKGKLEADSSASGSQAACPQCGSPVAIPEGRVEIGTTLAGFRLERFLGRGAMGEVYLARQLSVDRQVAVKVLPPGFAAKQDAVKRFLNEGRLAARLDHANVATVYEAGHDSGNYYLAMAYIEGESLDIRLKREGVLPEAEALGIASSVADALAYAWDGFHLLHRDIKPANIMVDLRKRIFLMDLGLAKSVGEETGMTLSGAILGTPQYMSPEQAQGHSGLGVASDVYSLGATLYHLTTGAPPFVGDSLLMVLHQHVHSPLPPPRERNPELSEDCALLIETMMAKDPGERHPDWRALLAELAHVQKGELPTHSAAGTHHAGVTSRSGMVHDAQAALAQQRQSPPKPAQATALHPSRPFHRSPLVLGVGAVSLALLLVLGIAVGRARKGTGKPKATAVATKTATTPQAGNGRNKGDKSGSQPPGKSTGSPQGMQKPPAQPEASPNEEPKPGEEKSGEPAPEPQEPAPEPPERPGAGEQPTRAPWDPLSLPHTGNWALEFDGEDDYVVVPTLRYEKEPVLTLEAVVRVAPEHPGVILGNPEGGGFLWVGYARERWTLGMSAGGEPGSIGTERDRPTPEGYWPLRSRRAHGGYAHVAGVWDGKEMRLYGNGILLAKRQDARLAAALRRGSLAPVMVGANPGADGRAQQAFLKGRVECIRVSRSVRYTGDFSLAGALPFKPDGDTLCLLDFEEGEGDVAKDASGNGNDGRIHGATWQHMWPCPLPESRLLAVEEAMRKANPGATGLALEVSGVPGGVGVRLVCQEGGSSQIRDIFPLASLPLRMLEARGTAISDLAPLRGLPLRFLDLTSSAVEDLSPLERAPITVLKIAETPVRDLAPLRGMPLRFLHLYHCKAVGDLAPLEGLPLEHLSIAGSSVTDVSALAGMPLRSLGLGPNTAVTDFLPLRSCTALELLVVGANPPSTGTLGELRKALPKLSLDTRQWTNVCFHDVLPRIMADLWEEPGPHAPPPASREKLPGKLLVSLLKGDFVAARKEAGGDASPQTLAVCAMQDRILESFRRDVGKTGVVKLRKEQIRCRIRGVTGSDVAVHSLLNRGGATVEAKRVVKYSMLSTEEKFSRLGRGEEPEILLMRGLLAVEADRLDVAGKLFARSGTPLGVALAGKLQEGRTRRTEEAAGRAARDVLSTVLPSTLPTSREDIIAEIRANCERRSRNLRSPGKASAAPSADTLLSRTRNLRSTRKAFAEYEKKHGETAAGRRWAKLFREAIDFPIPACNWTVPDVGMEFVWINALKMWVGKYEVTNGEYRAFNKANHSGPYLKYSLDGDRQPVVYVSFGEISAYAEWLTKREREAGRLPKQARYRLPAGREYITYAQCGDDRKYPWGNDWPPITGKAGNLGDTTSPMDSKFDTYTDGHPVTCKVEESRENPWGLFGIGGNVQECCANETEGKQTFEAWRGPDWHLHELPYVQCRSSRADAPEGMAFVGFRLVLSLK